MRLVDEPRAFGAHEFLSCPELWAPGAPVEAPVAEGVDDRQGLDARLREAVPRALTADGVVAGQDSCRDEPLRRSAGMFDAMPLSQPASSSLK